MPKTIRVGLIYVSIFLLTLILPLAVKRIASGVVGPASLFAVTVIVAPIGYFALGAFFGTRVLVAHLFVLAIAVLVTAIQYPYHAAMNPLREVPALWINKIVLAYLLGAIVAMFDSRRPPELRLFQSKAKV